MNKSLKYKGLGASAEPDRVPTGYADASVLPPSSEGTTPAARLRIVREAFNSLSIQDEHGYEYATITNKSGDEVNEDQYEFARLIVQVPDCAREALALRKAAHQALDDMRWVEANVPGSNFQSSIILLQAALGIVGAAKSVRRTEAKRTAAEPGRSRAKATPK